MRIADATTVSDRNIQCLGMLPAKQSFVYAA